MEIAGSEIVGRQAMFAGTRFDPLILSPVECRPGWPCL